jgi:SAM-dependent methyltransferase
MSKSVRDIIQDYLSTGNYSGTFEEIYALVKESEGHPPWAYMQAIPDLVNWAEKNNLSGEGKRAIVVGCGMGDDAEYLAKLGFAVTAFDVSQTAITICNDRFPDTKVDYQQADLFHLPEVWQGAFDFVLENRTIQSLPLDMMKKTMTAIANLASEKGELLILCNGRDHNEPAHNIPRPLSHEELKYFTEMGLTEQYFDDIHAGSVRRFVLLYQR